MDPGSSTDDRPPNRLYYERCEGRWRTRLDLRITNWTAFWRSPISLGDRWAFVLMALVPKWAHLFWLETSVALERDGVLGRVTHTTTVKAWGLSLFESVEQIELDLDGRRFRLKGEQRVWPFVGAARTTTGRGAVDADGLKASYALEWFAGELQQEGQLEPDGVTLTQTTAWSRGVQRLIRNDAR